eukprot:5218015-Pleurochrysis_carterae.AAC.1
MQHTAGSRPFYRLYFDSSLAFAPWTWRKWASTCDQPLVTRLGRLRLEREPRSERVGKGAEAWRSVR